MLIYSLVFLQKKGYRFETNSPVDWRRFIWTDEKGVQQYGYAPQAIRRCNKSKLLAKAASSTSCRSPRRITNEVGERGSREAGYLTA